MELVNEQLSRIKSIMGINESEVKTQKGSVIKRFKNDVGKEIGGFLYVHRNYAQDILSPEQYGNYLRLKSRLESYAKLTPALNDFDFHIIKYDLKADDVSFLMSKDFDTSPEPIIHGSILIKKDGNISYRKEEVNPTIYHHKWTMVKDDYSGFNVKDSIDRSKKWLALPDLDSAKIGRKDYWEKNILPKI